jgi:drug/metabolite transporter (DMT)-like permease
MTPPTLGRYNKPLTGAFLAFLSMSLFSWQDALIKFLSSDYSLFQILFIRSGIVVVPLFAILIIRYGKSAFHTKKTVDHAIRVLFNFIAFLSYYYAISRLPLSQATAIALSAPLFMTALSGPLLGEPADLRRKIILSVGFIGVILVVQPDIENTDWIGTMSVLFGAFMFAMLGIQTRKISATESTELMVFFGGITFFIVTGISLFMGWMPWHAPNPREWLLLLGVGTISLFAQLLIVHSYKFAAVYVIAPFEYVTILWALLLGWLMFAEIPTSLMLFGCLIIIICGLVIVHLEHRKEPPGKIAH